jgi:hypothetical protein
MDPITAAIVAALTAGATAAGPKVAEQGIVEAYAGLKGLLKRKFGGDSQVVQAVEALEAKPESAGRKGVLQEEVAAAKADQDPEVRQAAQTLQDTLGGAAGAAQVTVTASGARSIGIGGGVSGGSISTGDQGRAKDDA